MKNLNIVSIAGNLTRDSELRAAGNSKLLAFAVAVNSSRKVDGEWVDEPNYIDCILWGDRAEKLQGILKKGMKVAVSGKLHQSRWQKDGENRSKVEVYVDDMEIMAPKQQDNAQEDIPF